MRFKRIYIEITNRCNLSCSFCSKDNRDIREMSVVEFERVDDDEKDGEYPQQVEIDVAFPRF